MAAPSSPMKRSPPFQGMTNTRPMGWPVRWSFRRTPTTLLSRDMPHFLISWIITDSILPARIESRSRRPGGSGAGTKLD